MTLHNDRCLSFTASRLIVNVIFLRGRRMSESEPFFSWRTRLLPLAPDVTRRDTTRRSDYSERIGIAGP